MLKIVVAQDTARKAFRLNTELINRNTNPICKSLNKK